MASSATIITSWALLIWKALLKRGIDAHTIFKQLGLDANKLGDGNARYRLTDMTRLWTAALEETNDPCFGLEVGKSWGPTTFHALGFAWLASSSLADGLRRLERYSRIVNNSLYVSLEERGMQLHLELSLSEDVRYVHPAAHDASLAAILVMCRYLCGAEFSPLEIHTVLERSKCADSLEHFAGLPIAFNSAKNLIVFDRIRAEQRLASGNSELANINEQVAMKYLISIDRNSIVLLVKSAIVEMLAAGQVTEESVAKKLNISLRTLQRKLSEEQASFASIYQTLRRELAQLYIKDSQLSMTEIAFLLGYSEQSNFTRAFRRWYGVSPSDARQHIEQSALL